MAMISLSTVLKLVAACRKAAASAPDAQYACSEAVSAFKREFDALARAYPALPDDFHEYHLGRMLESRGGSFRGFADLEAQIAYLTRLGYGEEE